MKTLLLFRTTHAVIKAERLCRKQNPAVRVIPVPREISSECGMALELPPGHAEDIASRLRKAGITVEIANVGS